MAEGKNAQELKLEMQLKALLAEERIAKHTARKAAAGELKFTLERDDIVKGIILREVLGPPKAFEG